MPSTEEPREPGDAGDSSRLPARWAGRLDGPGAGWTAMVGGLAADVAIAEAEAYAAGERRLIVHFHDPAAGAEAGLDEHTATARLDEHTATETVRELVAAVDDAVRTFPGATSNPFTSISLAGAFTRWRFRPPAASEQLAAARAAVEQLNPGSWRIEADEH